MRSVLATVFPSPCAGCGVPLAWRDDALALCPPCRASLRRPLQPACGGCGRPLLGAWATARPRCGACRLAPPPWEAMTAAFLYLPPLVGVVRALKFGRAEHLGAELAAPLGERCAAWAPGLDLVTAVPLAWTRLLTRGYNQAEAVARPLAAGLGVPCRRLLRRRRRRPQALLARAERRRNLRGAFAPRREVPVGGTVLLVDDVMTTGATLVAATLALRRAGVARVLVAVVARTPEASWDEPLTAPAASPGACPPASAPQGAFRPRTGELTSPCPRD
ncbi:MAG TPA: phosphoribosyltransferase family protein [Thermoanaerobaculia bacterium]|nr:phosphoribosyltransferase family protein [Thermoanaerobaculia bacterium]